MVGMSHTAVALWANGQRRPDTEETFHKIYRATRGEVTPNDFFGINGYGIKKKKYRSIAVKYDGHSFDSKKEMRRYAYLKRLEELGDIANLELQPRFDIIMNGTKVAYYKSDFRYVKDGETIIEDVKSPATAKNPTYRLKKKLVEAQYGIKISEYI